jgi:hypothetical protein
MLPTGRAPTQNPTPRHSRSEDVAPLKNRPLLSGTGFGLLYKETVTHALGEGTRLCRVQNVERPIGMGSSSAKNAGPDSVLYAPAVEHLF